MKVLPVNVKPTRKTPEFNESSVPAGLLKAHKTKEGVWGKIVIVEGSLRYTITEPELEVLTLDANVPGIIEPNVLHEVDPIGSVRFFVQFYE